MDCCRKQKKKQPLIAVCLNHSGKDLLFVCFFVSLFQDNKVYLKKKKRKKEKYANLEQSLAERQAKIFDSANSHFARQNLKQRGRADLRCSRDGRQANSNNADWSGYSAASYQTCCENCCFKKADRPETPGVGETPFY